LFFRTSAFITTFPDRGVEVMLRPLPGNKSKILPSETGQAVSRAEESQSSRPWDNPPLLSRYLALACHFWDIGRIYWGFCAFPCKRRALNSKGSSLNSKGWSLNSKGLSLNSKGWSLNSKGWSLNSKGSSLNFKG
jgi:hypothetical protein